MKILSERSYARFTARFYDDGVPLMPTTVHWRLDCETTGNAVQDWVAVTPAEEVDELGVVVAVKAVVEVGAALNVMQSDRNRRERKHLLIVANKDQANEFSQVYEYEILNTMGRA